MCTELKFQLTSRLARLFVEYLEFDENRRDLTSAEMNLLIQVSQG